MKVLTSIIGRSFGVFSRLLNGVLGSGPCCRFEPSCSQYGKLALDRFGILKGILLTLGRLVRCRPGGDWGVDPVPQELGRKGL